MIAQDFDYSEAVSSGTRTATASPTSKPTTASPPSPLMAAVCAVMADVGKVKRQERNNHDGYNFVSIDGFLAATAPVMARHGLSVWHTEVEREYYSQPNRKGGETMWCRMIFDFWLTHTSGESTPRMRRHVPVMVNGPQSAGSGQSYALKQFLRGVFMIATGEADDPDFQSTQEQVEPTIDEPTAARIAVELDELQGDTDAFLAALGATSIGTIGASQGERALRMLAAKRKRMEEASHLS